MLKENSEKCLFCDDIIISCARKTDKNIINHLKSPQSFQIFSLGNLQEARFQNQSEMKEDSKKISNRMFILEHFYSKAI